METQSFFLVVVLDDKKMNYFHYSFLNVYDGNDIEHFLPD
jgi:hypothetical protein